MDKIDKLQVTSVGVTHLPQSRQHDPVLDRHHLPWVAELGCLPICGATDTGYRVQNTGYTMQTSREANKQRKRTGGRDVYRTHHRA